MWTVHLFQLRKIAIWKQVVISLVLISLVSFGCFMVRDMLDYRIVALLLLMVTTMLAMILETTSVFVAAAISALTLNYFFIPPYYTLHIDNSEDVFMFLIYFFISFLNIVLISKIRKEEMISKDREEKIKSIELYNTILHSLSHELKTPVAAIIGSVDLLESHESVFNSVQRKELYHQINLAAQRLNEQVSNLLAMSRLESGAIASKPDWCDTEEILHRLCNHLSELKNRRFSIECPDNIPLLKCDGGLLEIVLFNLLNNICQHTEPNTAAGVRVQEYEDGLEIRIFDEGKGIPVEERKAVFTKFYRLQGSPAGGTGLGLSLVKGFMDALNGKIVLTDYRNHSGCLFILYIPGDKSYIKGINHE